MSLLFNMLSRLVIAFLPRSKWLLISWLQSPSAVILEPNKIVSHCFQYFSIYLPWSDGTRCHDLRFLNWVLSKLVHSPLSLPFESLSCFWTVVLEKTLESPLDCKEIQPVCPKGNQSWIFIGRTDADAKTPILWPPDAKNWLTGKDPGVGKDWGQEEKGMTEDEMVEWQASMTQ